MTYSTGSSDAKLQSLKLDQARPPSAKDTMDTKNTKDTNEPKFQKLSFDKPLPPLPKPTLVDLAEEEDETSVTTKQTNKDKMVEMEVEEKETEAEFSNPEVKLVELDDHLAISVNKDEKDNQEIFKEEKTVAIKFGFSNSNRDSGFSSINSEEAFELEVDDDIDVEIEGPEEDKMEMPDKYSEAEESPDEILKRYKRINIDFSVALPDEVQSIEYVRDSTITVDLADHLLTEVVEEEDGKNNEVIVEEDGENEEKHENAAAESGSSLEDSAIDVDTPEKESTAGDFESEGEDFTKKLVSTNKDQRKIEEKSRQDEKRNLKPKFLKAVAELELEMAEGLKRREKEESENREIVSESEKESSAQDFQVAPERHFGSELRIEKGHRGESQYHREQENILRIAQGFTDEQDNSFTPIKKKTKRVSWKDEVQASEKLEREEKDGQPKKRERSRSQDSQEEEEDVSKEDLRRRPKEKSEKRRKSEYKKMRERDHSQDSQEDEDENETEEEMTIEERKIYEERVRENLRKIKKKPITQREVVHGRNNVSIFKQILHFIRDSVSN